MQHSCPPGVVLTTHLQQISQWLKSDNILRHVFAGRRGHSPHHKLHPKQNPLWHSTLWSRYGLLQINHESSHPQHVHILPDSKRCLPSTSPSLIFHTLPLSCSPTLHGIQNGRWPQGYVHHVELSRRQRHT